MNQEMKSYVDSAEKELKKAGIKYRIYNDGTLINAEDMDGITQSFYPTTGTVVLHASNKIRDRRTKVFKYRDIHAFINGMKTKNLTGLYFENEK
ncbi:MAG: hypothetical protein ACLTBR_10960 [Anaerostipes sp.]|uniref:hypothetical protein n=1 Tax=Anaerostipes sp. TaxID=1872530 RepID=UPI0039918EFB